MSDSAGTSLYAISTTTTSQLPPAAFFNPDGSLVYPGGGLPKLSGLLGESPTQFAVQESLNPIPFTTSATTNPNSPTGYVPPSFGNSSTQIYAGSGGQQGGFTTQGGVFWTTTTSLADNLGGGNLASLSLSTATAHFVNNGPNAITVTPAAILSVVGTIGTAVGSYVAAGLSTTITVSAGNTTISTTQLDPIVLAANNSVRIALTGNRPNEFGSLIVAGSALTGTATSFDPNSITLLSGQSLAINSTLTLISDPGSSIGISQNLTADFPTDPSFLPTFGVFADSPAITTPEPSTIVMLTLGLSLSGLWARSTRKRPSL